MFCGDLLEFELSVDVYWLTLFFYFYLGWEYNYTRVFETLHGWKGADHTNRWCTKHDMDKIKQIVNLPLTMYRINSCKQALVRSQHV